MRWRPNQHICEINYKDQTRPSEKEYQLTVRMLSVVT